MPNITLRNIPEELFEKIKKLSRRDRRSINNEILVILETSVRRTASASTPHTFVDRQSQISLWTDLCGQWEDSRPAHEITDDILEKRTPGRPVDL